MSHRVIATLSLGVVLFLLSTARIAHAAEPTAMEAISATPPAATASAPVEAVKPAQAPAPVEAAKTDPPAKEPATTPSEKKPFKGAYEAFRESPIRWLPEEDLFQPSKKPELRESLITPAAKKKLIDALFEPVLLLRMSYISTKFYRYKDSQGKERTSRDLLRTFLGYREGFVLENAEIGLKGRHNDTGLYYGVKLELMPREKDGTKEESEFLKEALVGWNYYSIVDAQVGRIKVPLSQQLQKGTTEMPFTYSPLIDTLLPKRLLGAKLTLSDPFKIVSVSGGAFNSTKQAHEQLSSVKNLLYAARAEFNLTNLLAATGHGHDRFFRFQMGGSYGYSKENFDPRTKIQYRGLDAHLDLYIFTFEGEYLVKDYYGEGLESYKALQGKGWHVDATIHAWPSVLDLSLRVEESDGNTSTHMEFPTTPAEAVNQKKRWISAGLMIHATRQIDFAVNYLHRGNLEGRDPNQDAVVTTLQFNL